MQLDDDIVWLEIAARVDAEALRGRSMICPIEARTSKSLPRNFSIVFALAGDSTITRFLVMASITPPEAFRMRGHGAEAARGGVATIADEAGTLHATHSRVLASSPTFTFTIAPGNKEWAVSGRSGGTEDRTDGGRQKYPRRRRAGWSSMPSGPRESSPVGVPGGLARLRDPLQYTTRSACYQGGAVCELTTLARRARIRVGASGVAAR